MEVKNTITRLTKFDAGHRVMHERFQCYHVHGHEYRVEMVFGYQEVLDLGYAIDFKEIKRVGCQWIDDRLDHAFIANPKDTVMIEACEKLESRLYRMHLLDGEGFCNPTAENIAKELFFVLSVLLNRTHPVKLNLLKVRLQETTNCWVECFGLEPKEWNALEASPLYHEALEYRTEKGSLEYDARKV